MEDCGSPEEYMGTFYGHTEPSVKGPCLGPRSMEVGTSGFGLFI